MSWEVRNALVILGKYSLVFLFPFKDFESYHGLFNVLVSLHTANFKILETSCALILPKSQIERREERWILNYIVIKLFVKFKIPIIIMLLEDICRDERVDVDVHEGDGEKGDGTPVNCGIWRGDDFDMAGPHETHRRPLIGQTD